jgi:hypothetical protein
MIPLKSSLKINSVYICIHCPETMGNRAEYAENPEEPNYSGSSGLYIILA